VAASVPAVPAELSADALGDLDAPLSPGRLFARRFLRHRLGVFGLAVLASLLLLTLLAPLLAPWGAGRSDYAAIGAGPSLGHPLGTDTAGRDVWARVLFGGRVSLSVGIIAVAISTSIGTLVGLVSGYLGGWVDTVLQRLTELVMVIPALFLILIVVSLVGPSIQNIMVVIGLLGWEGLARLVRGQVLSLREQEYVQAALALGAPSSRVIARHLLPAVVPFVVVSATFRLAGAVITEAGLSFLGLGVQPPDPSWGNMLNQARSLSILVDKPWLWLPPGLCICMAVLAINALGDAVRDALDPRTLTR
jgi:peptide/nickel transport system permease protein